MSAFQHILSILHRIICSWCPTNRVKALNGAFVTLMYLSDCVTDSVCDVDSAALMASRALPLMSRGDVYQQVEWVLLDAHSLLLEHHLSAEARDVHAVAAACERLSALIRRVSLPINDDLLRLQLKVSLDAQSVQGLLLISGTSVL